MLSIPVQLLQLKYEEMLIKTAIKSLSQVSLVEIKTKTNSPAPRDLARSTSLWETLNQKVAREPLTEIHDGWSLLRSFIQLTPESIPGFIRKVFLNISTEPVPLHPKRTGFMPISFRMRRMRDILWVRVSGGSSSSSSS